MLLNFLLVAGTGRHGFEHLPKALAEHKQPTIEFLNCVADFICFEDNRYGKRNFKMNNINK